MVGDKKEIKKNWRNILTILMFLTLVWPMAIAFTWFLATWKVRTKIVITALIFVLFVLLIFLLAYVKS